MKMRFIAFLFFAFAPIYVIAACADPPIGIPRNPLGEGDVFAFPSVVAIDPSGETRPAIFYKKHQTDIVEIYDAFGVLVKRFDKGDRNEVKTGTYADCAYKWYGESGTGNPSLPEYIWRF